MFGVLLAFLLVLPFLEIWVAIQVAGVIGGPLTLLALVAMSIAGVYLLSARAPASGVGRTPRWPPVACPPDSCSTARWC